MTINDPLNALELDQVLKDAGFTTSYDRRNAWAVAMRESRGIPGATSPLNPNGTRDWGLFQINDIHKARFASMWSDRLLPATNAHMAFVLSDGGKNWGAWGLGDTGWAGYLKENAPDTWKMFYDRWRIWFDAYPTALAEAITLSKAGVVALTNLQPGDRNADVAEYQVKLRAFLGSLEANRLNPSGATSFYGRETRAMTRAAYEKVARLTGNPAWLKGDLTIPGPGLLNRIGLRVA